MRLVKRFAIVSAVLTAACSTPPASDTARTAAPATPRRPNIVFVLVDDMRWDDLRAAGHPFIETPNMDRLAARGRALHQRVRHDAAVLAEPGQLPDRPVSAHATASSTTPRVPSHALPVVPARAAEGRLSHRLLRQVAHGQRRQPAPGLRPLGGDARPGRSDRPVAERRRQARAGQGLHHRPPHRLRRALHRSARRRAVPGVSRPQGDPSERDPERRRQPHADCRPARGLRRRRAPSRPLRRPADAAPGQRVRAAARQAGAAPADRRAAAARDATPRRPTRRSAAASRCCSASTTASAASWRRWPARASSTTRWSSSPATTATSTASTGSTRSGAWPTKRRSASRCIVRFPRLARGRDDTPERWRSASTWRRRCSTWPASRRAARFRAARWSRCSTGRPPAGARRS